MNSATSIEKAFSRPVKKGSGAPPDGKAQPGESPNRADAAFRPWHFFVLASLVAATAAVIVSRQSTPEHLILISVTIGAAGLAAAGFYRMLAPLAADDIQAFTEPLSERARAVLEREKTLALRAIKEVEFDRAMAKLSARDFDEMAGRLRARAIALMKQLDEGTSPYTPIIERELSARLAGGGPAPETVRGDLPMVCPACGTANDPDAAFCKRCGGRLAVETAAGTQQ